MVSTIFTFIAVLAVLVLAHEWGHFYAARRLGIAVKEFGFGFPPRLAGFLWRGTMYTINWLPLGGFVKLKGEGEDELEAPDSFAVQPAWKRTLVLVAGVAMNVVVAWLLLSITLGVGIGTALSDSELSRARNVEVQVIGVAPNSPAERAGVQVGDVVVSLDSTAINRIGELQSYLGERANQPTQVALKRDGAPLTITVAPTELPGSSGRPAIGVNLVHRGVIAYPWHEAFIRGAVDTWRLGREIVLAFGRLFGDLLARGTVPQDISGPVGIAVLTGQVAELGFVYLMQFTALLSLNLAIINILPFPALDGGRVLFVIIEKLRRRQVTARIESITHTVGFTLLMVLILVITYRDLVRFGGGFFSRLGSLWGS